MTLIPDALLSSTCTVIRCIEDTLAELDPYNQPFPLTHCPEADPQFSLSCCDFPDQVDDPLALIRLLRGDDFARQLEYEGYLDAILYHLNDCLREELGRRGQTEADFLLFLAAEAEGCSDEEAHDEDERHRAENSPRHLGSDGAAAAAGVSHLSLCDSMDGIDHD